MPHCSGSNVRTNSQGRPHGTESRNCVGFRLRSGAGSDVSCASPGPRASRKSRYCYLRCLSGGGLAGPTREQTRSDHDWGPATAVTVAVSRLRCVHHHEQTQTQTQTQTLQQHHDQPHPPPSAVWNGDMHAVTSCTALCCTDTHTHTYSAKWIMCRMRTHLSSLKLLDVNQFSPELVCLSSL